MQVSDADIAFLRRTFNSICQFDETAFNEMLRYWTTVSYKRKVTLTRTGETERYLYITVQGVQRGFCIYGDKEATMVFFYPVSFAGVADSFLLQRPSGMDIETLTDSRLLRITYHDLMAVAAKYPSVEKWLRVMLSHALAGALERQKELTVYSAADKLAALFQRSAHIFNLIPHKYLASYIGVEPATFSKLYTKLRSTEK